MDTAISRVIIVGGGTAGWLSACLIAARANPRAEHPISVTLVESPDIPSVGVGEGTWPTMRGTLERIGHKRRRIPARLRRRVQTGLALCRLGDRRG